MTRFAWILLGCLCLSGCDPGSRADERLARAQRMSSTGEFRGAVLELRNVLKSDPSSAPARLMFADVLYRTGDLQNAQLELDRVPSAQLQASASALRARLLVARREPQRALVEIEAALDGKPSPADTAVLEAARGDTLLALGRYDSAGASLKRAPPADLRALVSLAGVLEHQGDLPGANRTLSQALARDSGYAPAWSALGALLLQAGDARRAEAHFLRASSPGAHVETAGDRIWALAGLSEARLALGDIPGAGKVVAELELLAPNAPVTVLRRAQLAAAKGDYAAASGRLQALVHSDARNAEAWALLSNVQSASGDVPAAEESLRNALAAAPDNLEIRRKLAQLQLRLGKPAAAVDALAAVADDTSVPPSSPDQRGHAWTAKELSSHALLLAGELASGRQADAEAELVRWPSSVLLGASARIAALAGASTSGARSAATTMRAITGGASRDASRLLLSAMLLIRIGDTESALVRARSAAAVGDEAALLSAVDVIMGAGRPQEAVDLLRRSRPTGNGVPVEVELATARALLAAGAPEAARRSLEVVRAARPDWPQALILEAQVDLRQGDSTAALATVKRLQTVSPATAAAFVLEGDILAERAEYSAAAAAYSRAAARTSTWQPVVREYQMRRAAHEANADAPLRIWLTGHPADYPVRAALASHLASIGSKAAAIEELEKIRRQRPDDAVTLNDLAWLYGELHDSRALALARRAAELQPEDPSVGDTLGWLLVQSGDARGGLQFLDKAARSRPNDLTIRFHRGYAQVAAGERALGEATLKQLLAAGGSFPERQLAEDVLRTMPPPRSLKK